MINLKLYFFKSIVYQVVIGSVMKIFEEDDVWLLFDRNAFCFLLVLIFKYLFNFQ